MSANIAIPGLLEQIENKMKKVIIRYLFYSINKIGTQLLSKVSSSKVVDIKISTFK